MKKRLRIILPLLLIIAVGVAVYRNYIHVDDDTLLRFSGNIEVTESQMSFQIPGRLQERLVEEGESVSKKQPLARLDKTDQTIKVAQTEANLAYASSVLAELEAGSRKEEIDRTNAKVLQARHSLLELQNGSRIEDIEAAKAELDRAVAAEQSAIIKLNQAERNYTRYTNLHKDGSVSDNIFESVQTLYNTAGNQVSEARGKTKSATERLSLLKAGPRIEQINKAEAVLAQVEAEYALIKAGPREEKIDQARAKVQIALSSVQQARQQLTYTELIAPMDGVVLNVSAEPGEYLNPASPVLTLGNLDKPWLRAYISEKVLGKIQLNQKVTVSTDSFPDKKYEGRVSFISSEAEFTPKTVQTFEERVKLVYRIKVALQNEDNELKPGMPADGVINLGN
ncbi:MAG: HlyD family secretion protein [Desulforhopalus sp.]|jgi:HlyD family secretion protein